jgi:putative Mg2+ transporter-C (MgtC) family protein
MDAWIQGLEQAAPWLRPDLLGRLLLATVLGGLIGWDREIHGKPAGLRTNILICIGSTLITDLSIRFPDLSANELVRSDPARIAAQIVSGIGFLGAGTIIQSRGSVSGLTTAATLWVVAGIGMAVGSGHETAAIGAAVLVLLVLMPLGRLERHVSRVRRGRSLRLEVAHGPTVIGELAQLLEDEGLKVATESVERHGDRLVVRLDVVGGEASFRSARQRLIDRTDVRSLHVG